MFQTTCSKSEQSYHLLGAQSSSSSTCGPRTSPKCVAGHRRPRATAVPQPTVCARALGARPSKATCLCAVDRGAGDPGRSVQREDHLHRRSQVHRERAGEFEHVGFLECENPRVAIETKSLMVWAAVTFKGIIGPYFVDGRMNQEQYRLQVWERSHPDSLVAAENDFGPTASNERIRREPRRTSWTVLFVLPSKLSILIYFLVFN